VVARAAERDVAVESLAGYCARSPGEPGLVIGFGAIDADRIEPGLLRLAEAFEVTATAAR
jgi:GntR family transcriptional regulator / MocR family aminotransferase